MSSCIFCKIIGGEIPSLKVFENELTYAFLDINPLSKGHVLIIPKFCGAKLHDIPDEYLADLLPVAKRVAIATGASDYNVLQNNGSIAHQAVFHVHVHIIPKPNVSEGLGIEWKSLTFSKESLKELADGLSAKLSA
eukprot:CFRG3161T1